MNAPDVVLNVPTWAITAGSLFVFVLAVTAAYLFMRRGPMD